MTGDEAGRQEPEPGGVEDPAQPPETLEFFGEEEPQRLPVMRKGRDLTAEVSRTRNRLVWAIVLPYVVLIGLGAWNAFRLPADQAEVIIERLVQLLGLLVGGAVAFYFGERLARPDSGSSS